MRPTGVSKAANPSPAAYAKRSAGGRCTLRWRSGRRRPRRRRPTRSARRRSRPRCTRCRPRRRRRCATAQRSPGRRGRRRREHVGRGRRPGLGLQEVAAERRLGEHDEPRAGAARGADGGRDPRRAASTSRPKGAATAAMRRDECPRADRLRQGSLDVAQADGLEGSSTRDKPQTSAIGSEARGRARTARRRGIVRSLGCSARGSPRTPWSAARAVGERRQRTASDASVC